MDKTESKNASFQQISVAIWKKELPRFKQYAKQHHLSLSRAIFALALTKLNEIAESGIYPDIQDIEDDEYEESCINLAKNPIFPR